MTPEGTPALLPTENRAEKYSISQPRLPWTRISLEMQLGTWVRLAPPVCRTGRSAQGSFLHMCSLSPHSPSSSQPPFYRCFHVYDSCSRQSKNSQGEAPWRAPLAPHRSCFFFLHGMATRRCHTGAQEKPGSDYSERGFWALSSRSLSFPICQIEDWPSKVQVYLKSQWIGGLCPRLA